MTVKHAGAGEARVWTDERWAEVAELRAQGYTTKQLYEYYGVTKHTFHEACKRYRIRLGTYPIYTDELLEQIRHLIAQGYHWAEIGRKLNLPAGFYRSMGARGITLDEKIHKQRIHIKRLIASRKQDAKNYTGYTVSITEWDLWPWPEFCPMLGVPLLYKAHSRKGVGVRSPYLASIDRISSSSGYIPGNVHIISWRANRLKNNASVEEILRMGQWAQIQLAKESQNEQA